MIPWSVTELARRLVGATGILRGSVDVSAYLGIVTAMLVLKRFSDQPGIVRVPDGARWPRIVAADGASSVNVVRRAVRELQESNPEVLGGVLDALDLSRRLGPTELKALIDYFDEIPLGDNDLELGDVVGRAYDRVLGWFAERAGKMGGEFYTPRSVVRLMVRLVRPLPGQSVYDPFVGSAGMLVQAAEYVEEHSGEGASLALFGQEQNVATWAIGRLNLLLHGVIDESVLRGNTLTDPLHMVVDGQRKQFDRVLSNPPFSMNYTEKGMKYPERMRYGWTPGQGKKADLMNIQHVLSMLRPDGIGAVVAPQGALFRGGTEATIRQGIVEAGRLEAVIGIGPNVFHGTAIPACILVLRGADGPPDDRRGQVLFINAEREVVTSRMQNQLEPQHVEKIVRIFRSWSDVPGFSRAVSAGELATNGFNLNIRRYVNSSLFADPPLDVHAALAGGVPKREVNANASRFHVFGIDPADLFRIKDSHYFDFPDEGFEVTAGRIQELASPAERHLINLCNAWWERTALRTFQPEGLTRLMALRSKLIESFCEALLPSGILDQYQLPGVFASWWHDHKDILRTLDRRDSSTLIERWEANDHKVPQGDSGSARSRTLDALGDDLCSRVEKLIATERQSLIDTYNSWGDRYATSLADLDEQRARASVRLESRLAKLGYLRTNAPADADG